jgi:hypothetical protein
MTQRVFQDMLNEYLTNDLLKEELLKRDYIMSHVERDESWKGGKIPVPFRGARATSVRFGKLTAAGDIAQSKFVRGSIDDYVEVWSSLVFNHRDLQEHNGKIPETTFLRILPDEVDDMMDYVKEVCSIQLGTGPHFATIVDDTSKAVGIMKVDKIDRFWLDQKMQIVNSDGDIATIYVIAIDINTDLVTFSLTRGGAAADLTLFTVAKASKTYHDNVTDGSGTFTTFTSFRSAFLSAANGGTATIHGKSKLAYTQLQSVNILGSDITASNILDKLFDAYTAIRQKARGNASTILLSFKHLGSIMKKLEAQKGPFMVTKAPAASLYGWTEMEITCVKGTLTIVGIQEFGDDCIMFIDWSAMKFMTNGFFKKRISPDGREYFETRSEDGYQYIVDISLFGEMMFTKLSNCGIVYSISY